MSPKDIVLTIHLVVAILLPILAGGLINKIWPPTTPAQRAKRRDYTVLAVLASGWLMMAGWILIHVVKG